MHATESPADRQPSPLGRSAENELAVAKTDENQPPPIPPAVSCTIHPSQEDYWCAQTLLMRGPPRKSETANPESNQGPPPESEILTGQGAPAREPPTDEALEELAQQRAKLGGDRFDLSNGLREPKYAIDFVHMACVDKHWSDAKYREEIRRCQERNIDSAMVADVYTALIQNALSNRSLFELAARCDQGEGDQRGRLIKEFARRFMGMQRPLPVSAPEIRTVEAFVENLDQRRLRVVKTGSGRYRTAITARMRRFGLVSNAWNSAGHDTGASHPDFGQSEELRALSAVVIAGKFLSMISPAGCIGLINELIQVLEEEQQIAETALQAKPVPAPAVPVTAGPASPSNCSLYCDHGIWTLSFRGQSRPLSRARGFALLAHLLLHPGKEFNPMKLEEAAIHKTSVRSEAAAETESDAETRISRAVEIEELKTKIRAAVEDGDTKSAEDLNHNLEVLKRLHRAEYHNKKPRRIDPAHTNARQRVYRNIETALEILRSKWPEVHAEFLDLFKRGGVYKHKHHADLLWTASPEGGNTTRSVAS
ncbi:MAG: hypothetical protein JNL50_05775 [Phycisphaerae bacterium]|nr:hypothetical protein [Phycisphaerae bacterium]